jgi:hypothetical protein
MNYDNITFVTHLRYDHNDRIKNLQTIIKYYSNNFKGSKFIFIEDDKEHNSAFDKITWPKNTSFYFVKNEGLYYRTRALNYGINQATTPIVVSLDTDCIVSVNSFNVCIKELLNDATIAWPYNGFFIDVADAIHQEFIKHE